MKPTFKKTVLDLVEWHNLEIFVIIETRIDGNRTDDIIRRLSFDGGLLHRDHWACRWHLAPLAL